MVLKRYTLFILFLTSFLKIYSVEIDSNKIDSLTNILTLTPEKDQSRILNKLSDAYLDVSFEKSQRIARRALKLSIENNNYKEKANAYINLANAAWYTSITDSVLYYYNISLNIYVEHSDSNGIADSFNRIALVYDRTGEYDKSLEFMEKAIFIYKQKNNKLGLARVENNIGIIYNNIGQTKEALEHYKQAQILFQAVGVKREEANVINNIGTVYFESEQIDSSIFMIKKAVQIHLELTNQKALASEYSNLGILYSEKENYQLAEQYFEKSLKIQNEIKNKYGLSNVQKDIADMYFTRKEYKKAVLFFKQSLSIKVLIEDLQGLSYIYKTLSSLYDSISNPQEALKYHRLYVDAWQKAYNLEKEEQIAEITTKYKTEEKIKKNILLQKEINEQKRRQWMLSILTIGLLFFTIIIFVALRLKSKLLRQTKLNYAQKEELSKLEIKNKEIENKRLQAETKRKEIETKMLSEDIKTQQKINELQKEKHKIDIEYKNKELITTTMHVVNKNKVLDDIKKIIKKEMEAESFSKANLQKIINEINFNINLDKDWDDFKMHFEVVNTNFFDRLQKQYPKLTQNDLKLCAYMRMNLSSKEIAQIMNITLSAINKSRNRLRKKMNLDSNINLTQYMAEY